MIHAHVGAGIVKHVVNNKVVEIVEHIMTILMALDFTR